MSTGTDPRHLHLPGVEVVTPRDDRPSGPRELDWKPQPMVDWLHPGQLLATAIRTLLSTVFGSYADRREVAAALALAPGTGEAEPHFYDHTAPPAPAPERKGGFWIDYTADLGDGFKPGYTVASFLGAPAVRVGNRPALQAAEQRPTA